MVSTPNLLAQQITEIISFDSLQSLLLSIIRLLQIIYMEKKLNRKYFFKKINLKKKLSWKNYCLELMLWIRKHLENMSTEIYSFDNIFHIAMNRYFYNIKSKIDLFFMKFNRQKTNQ